MISKSIFSTGLLIFTLFAAEGCQPGNSDQTRIDYNLLRRNVERINILEKEQKGYEQRFTDVSNQLNENMVDRMDWQLSWFTIFLAMITLLNSGVIVLGYKYLRNKVRDRVNPPLKKFERNSEAILRTVYENTIKTAQGQIALIDVSKRSPDTFANYVKQILRQMNTEIARLRVSLGDSDEVIAGANILSQWGTLDIDVPILRGALKREGLLEEAKETLERAIRDLEKKPK